MADLSETLAAMLSRSDAPLLEVIGPPDLLDALLAGMGPAATARVEVRPDPDEAEIRLVADCTAFETRLAAWRDRLSAACRDRPEDAARGEGGAAPKGDRHG